MVKITTKVLDGRIIGLLRRLEPKAIAARLGISISRIYDVRRRSYLDRRYQTRHGGEDRRGRPDGIETLEITVRNDKIMQFRSTKTRKWIANKFCMSLDAVNKVIERRLSKLKELCDRGKWGQQRLKKDLYNKWITIKEINPYSFEEAAGCYVFFSKGKPFYVGQSANIQKRMIGHGFTKSLDGSYYTAWGEMREVAVKVKYHRRYGEWLECEARLIKRLKTKFNRKAY